MKTKVETVQVMEVPNEGLISLLGERVLLMCGSYFYHGTLAGVNDEFVKLNEVAIVYETGSWNASKFTDAQSLGTEPHFVMKSHIESYRKDTRRQRD